jgi:hypothetical protein
MCTAQCCDHFLLPFFWKDCLEPQLRDALLAPGLTVRRTCAFAAEEGPRSLRVPGAVLVLADTSGARLEEGSAHRVESFARHEDDELAVQVSVSICAFCSLPL